MVLQTSVKLNSGYEIPTIGLGTWLSKPNEVKNAVEAALRAGYRHIDGAAIYENEVEVGDGIKASGVDRKEIFLTGKVWNTHHRPEDVERHLDQTLSELQTDYLDLYLIHWPAAFRFQGDKTYYPVNAEGAFDLDDVPISETWKAMEALVAKGKVRSIGVSNFTRERIEKLWETAKIRPAVNQIEAHPYLQQKEFLQWQKDNGIVVEAYSPMGNNIYGKPRAIDDPKVIDLAKSLDLEPAQLLVSWSIQRGTVVLPKSITPSRIQSNLVVKELPQSAIDTLEALDTNTRYNCPKRWGYNIFGEWSDAEIKAAVDEFVASKKQ